MLILIDALTLATVAAYVCRLDAINIRVHRSAIVLVHLLGAMVSAMAAGYAVLGPTTGLTPVVYIGWAAAVAWLALTFRSYRHGPPIDAVRPEVLAAEMHARVVGGRQR